MQPGEQLVLGGWPWLQPDQASVGSVIIVEGGVLAGSVGQVIGVGVGRGTGFLFIML